VIRQAERADIPAIADIHAAALPNDLLPRLGKRFLRETFYPAVIDSGIALTIVETVDGELQSFVIFARDSERLTRQVTRRKLALARHGLIAMLRDFALVGEIWSHLKGFRAEFHIEPPVPLNTIPEVYLIATAPGRQSRGSGGRLLEHGIAMLGGKDPECVVRTSSEGARRFYARHGFHRIGVEYRHNRHIHILLRRPGASGARATTV
jgi:ribosomal protein S18 acetylase RimI-like enzyme